MRTSPTLTTLAPDLILYILGHSRPIDIITLRQTCKTMLEFTKLRTVWTTATRTVMEKLSISEQALALETIPRRLLEHVAVAPHRLLSLLQRCDGSSVRPISIRVLAPRLTNAEKETYGIDDNNGLYDSLAESSGRYLASLSAYEAFTPISIWDLGVCGHDVIKPLARYLEPGRSKLYLDGFWPGPSGSNSFYLVSTHESSLVTPLSVFVHEVSMSSPSRIRFLAKLEIPLTTPFIFARTFQIPQTSKLVLQYDDEDDNKHFRVWDFVANTAAAMIAVDYRPTGNEMFLHYDDCIIAAHEGRVRIYNTPPMLGLDQVNEPTPSKATIIIAAPSKSQNSFFVGHDLTQDLPFYFLEVTPTRLTFFEVASNNRSHDVNLPNRLPMAAGSLIVDDAAFWSRDQRFIAMTRCEDRLLLPSFSNTGNDSGDLHVFSVTINHLFGGGGGRAANLSKTTLMNPMVMSRHDIKKRRFCPMLGRVCVHTRQRLSYSRSACCVYILDYLGAPDSPQEP